MNRPISLLLIITLTLASGIVLGADGRKAERSAAGKRVGLSDDAIHELRDAGVDRYLGKFEPAASFPVGDGWIKHTFDPDFGEAGPNGPVCIAGTPYSVFTRAGRPDRLLIFEQGGGACWQDFYNCNVLSEAQEPPAPRVGIWDFDNPDNAFADHSIVYMPYCDGSVFTGDNDVFDPAFGADIGAPQVVFRFHRGVRNQSAGMDVAKAMFPDAKRITVAGSSAGGVGAAGFAPLLVRLVYGNRINLTVFNDAGPITTNLNDAAAVAARASDWDFGKFFPASCSQCDDMGDSTGIVKWRLDNDSTVREAFYETDNDLTNRFFLDLLLDPFGFYSLVVSGHGAINAAHPDRYKRFIVSGDASHTALQDGIFYTQESNGNILNEWTKAFIRGNDRQWQDTVEDFVFVPPPAP